HHTTSTGESHVYSPRLPINKIQTHPRRRRRPSPPRFRLRQHHRNRSLPAPRRFPQRKTRRLSGRFSVASSSRHRNHHLRFGRRSRSRRQHRQQRGHHRRRRPMDDRRPRHRPPGNASRQRQRPDARLPALGQSSREFKNDRPALSGSQSPRNSSNHRRRRHHRAPDHRPILGQAR